MNDSDPFGLMLRELLATRPGLELLQAMIRGELPMPPIARRADC